MELKRYLYVVWIGDFEINSLIDIENKVLWYYILDGKGIYRLDDWIFIINKMY